MTDDERGAPTSEAERPAGSPPGVRFGARGRATSRRQPERPCLNCGDSTPGEYCRSCGQRKVEVLVSVRAMVADLLEDEFVLNRRLPHSLFGLWFRPGFLTVEHVNGRIARYVRPLRLYLASSIVFFLLLSFYSLRMLERSAIDAEREPAAGAADSSDVAGMDSVITTLRVTLADTTLSPLVAVGIEESLRALEVQRDRAVTSMDTTARPDTAGTPRPSAGQERTRTLAERFDLGGARGSAINVNTGDAAFDSVLVRRARLLGAMTPRQAAERLIGDFLNYIPMMMFVLLPLFALVLKLFYVRRRRFYAEHFVFLLHVHAFVYLVFAVLLVIRGAFPLSGALMSLLLVWTAVYIYLAMKRVYGQGWLKTLVKYSLLGWMYFLILGVSVPLVFALSILLL